MLLMDYFWIVRLRTLYFLIFILFLGSLHFFIIQIYCVLFLKRLLSDMGKKQTSFAILVCGDHKAINEIILLALTAKWIESLKQVFFNLLLLFKHF